MPSSIYFITLPLVCTLSFYFVQKICCLEFISFSCWSSLLGANGLLHLKLLCFNFFRTTTAKQSSLFLCFCLLSTSPQSAHQPCFSYILSCFPLCFSWVCSFSKLIFRSNRSHSFQFFWKLASESPFSVLHYFLGLPLPHKPFLVWKYRILLPHHIHPLRLSCGPVFQPFSNDIFLDESSRDEHFQ